MIRYPERILSLYDVACADGFVAVCNVFLAYFVLWFR